MSDDIHLMSAGAPNGVGEYQWPTTDTVVAVPRDFALQLLRIQGGGFHEAPPYEALPKRGKKTIETEPTPETPPVEKPPVVVTGEVAAANTLAEGLGLVSPKGTRSRKVQ